MIQVKYTAPEGGKVAFNVGPLGFHDGNITTCSEAEFLSLRLDAFDGLEVVDELTVPKPKRKRRSTEVTSNGDTGKVEVEGASAP